MRTFVTEVERYRARAHGFDFRQDVEMPGREIWRGDFVTNDARNVSGLFVGATLDRHGKIRVVWIVWRGRESDACFARKFRDNCARFDQEAARFREVVKHG